MTVFFPFFAIFKYFDYSENRKQNKTTTTTTTTKNKREYYDLTCDNSKRQASKLQRMTKLGGYVLPIIGLLTDFLFSI